MTTACKPPELPAYLTGTFDLKPVVGTPSDDQVRTIHAVIRAVENISQVPALCDPGLSMQLAQHLFDVQMTRYRERYLVNIFTSDNTYTPPTLPSHVNVPLKPITGPPSDGELKMVHTALRASENLANVPSMFDPDLSMSLSQHLFDIQFARYIQRTMEGCYNAHDTLPTTESNKTPAKKSKAHTDAASDSEPAVPVADQLDEPGSGSKHERDTSLHDTPPRSPDTLSQTITLLEATHGVIEQMKCGQDQANQLLAGMQNGLENVTKLMIKLHNHSARGFNSSSDCMYHHIVTENGNAPMDCYVPWGKNTTGFNYWENASDSILAQCLMFYNFGPELIDKREPPTLKPGSREAAKILLGQNTHSRPK